MNIEGTEDPDIPLAQDVLDAMVVEPEWASLTAFLQAHFKVGGERLSDLRAMQCAIVAATRLKSGTFCCSRTRWVGLVRGVVLLLYEVSCFFLIAIIMTRVLIWIPNRTQLVQVRWYCVSHAAGCSGRSRRGCGFCHSSAFVCCCPALPPCAHCTIRFVVLPFGCPSKGVGTCTATWWYLAVDLLALTCRFSNYTHHFLPVCCGRVLYFVLTRSVHASNGRPP